MFTSQPGETAVQGESPELTFVFEDLWVERFFVFAAFLSSLCLSQEGSPFLLLILRFISGVYLRFGDASTIGDPER